MSTTIDKLANRSFVLLRAEWSVGRSLDLLEQLDSTHVIVRHGVPQNVYFLFQSHELRDLLETQVRSVTLNRALNLEDSRATPVVESSETTEGAPARCVITEEGNLTGFFDATYRPRVTRGSKRNLKTVASTITASLVAELPERIATGEKVSLLVYISSDFTHGALPITLTEGKVVDVLVQTKRGFVLEGRTEGRLTIRGEKETLPLQFKLKAVAKGSGLIRVFAFHKGQPLGVVSLSPNVVEADAGVNVAPVRNDQPLLATARVPDLSLFIVEETVNGIPAISLWLTAADAKLGLNLKKYGPVSLRVDSFHYFQEFFKDIENLPLGSSEQRSIAAARMAAKGSTLFEALMPESLRADIWKLRGNIKSVEVQSEEPWVPWELCKMSGEEDGRVVEGPFFAEAFNITRWLPGVPRKQTLSLRNVGVVVPQDSGLRYTRAEHDYMLSLSATGATVNPIPATFLDVRSALASGVYDGLHFSGHGVFRDADPNRSALILEKGGDLTPEDLSGVVRNLGHSQPIVFLNACQIGRGGMSLTDVGGWASQFLRAGAGAFIGTYWSVYDRPAYDFAQAFYDRLLQGKPIGEAAREARSAIRPAGDPTWLAYTVFADPLATLSGTPEE